MSLHCAGVPLRNWSLTGCVLWCVEKGGPISTGGCEGGHPWSPFYAGETEAE